MEEKDKEKTTFITYWRIFSYKVMPFGLKNMGATYRSAMVMFFYDMMHKEVEVYMDDRISKSKGEENPIKFQHKLFERL